MILRLFWEACEIACQIANEEWTFTVEDNYVWKKHFNVGVDVFCIFYTNEGKEI